MTVGDEVPKQNDTGRHDLGHKIMDSERPGQQRHDGRVQNQARDSYQQVPGQAAPVVYAAFEGKAAIGGIADQRAGDRAQDGCLYRPDSRALDETDEQGIVNGRRQDANGGKADKLASRSAASIAPGASGPSAAAS